MKQTERQKLRKGRVELARTEIEADIWINLDSKFTAKRAVGFWWTTLRTLFSTEDADLAVFNIPKEIK